jgi:hypothetical protein
VIDIHLARVEDGFSLSRQGECAEHQSRHADPPRMKIAVHQMNSFVSVKA